MTTIPFHELTRDFTPQDRALLSQRAQQLAQQQSDKTVDQTNARVLVFELGQERYALPIQAVQAVHPLRRYTRVPFAPPHIMGVTNLRGIILPLVNLLPLLKNNDLVDLMMTIVVQSQGLHLGLMASRVQEVQTVDLTLLTPPPAGGPENEFIQGITPDSVILLDFERVLKDPRMIVEEGTYL